MVQCTPFIMISVASIGMDCIIDKSCCEGTILQRNYRKMTISWSFSYNSFVKFHGIKKWEAQNHVIPKSVLLRGEL